MSKRNELFQLTQFRHSITWCYSVRFVLYRNTCIHSKIELGGHYASELVIYAAHICSCVFRIFVHTELFGLFLLFALFLEEFDYTATVQHVLHVRTAG